MARGSERKARVQAREMALLERGWPPDWAPFNGEWAIYANVCKRCRLAVIEEARVYVDAKTLEAFNCTIDVQCPTCGAMIALRAFPTYEVARRFLDLLNEKSAR